MRSTSEDAQEVGHCWLLLEGERTIQSEHSPGDDADLCGIAELEKELLAIFPGEAECAQAMIQPCWSQEGTILNGRVNAALSGACRFSARPG